MPQLPESVVIVTRDGVPRELHIDGAEFPWYISEEGITLRYPDKAFAHLELGILVDADRINFKEQTND